MIFLLWIFPTIFLLPAIHATNGPSPMHRMTYSYQPTSPPKAYIHDDSFHADRILRITNMDYPMDCTHRYSVIINGTIPGPELRFHEGDKVWIRVYNDMLTENLTIHWHGLGQRMSPFSDGAPAVSQWPIPPLHYFDYEFQLRDGDAGTYFYHAHTSFAAVTAFGALIVDERPGFSPPFQYDEERVLLFSDIFHTNDSYIVSGLMGDPFRWSGETQNIALNGQSRSANATQPSTSCSYSTITILPDRTYRFRFIGATALSQVFVAFQDHPLEHLTLIEVDGKYISPIPVSHLQLHTGQRYSVLLKSKSLEQLMQDRVLGREQYWVQMETRSRALITTAYAVLTYNDVDSVKPDTFTKPLVPPLILPNETFMFGWIEGKMRPLASRPYDDTLPTLAEVTRRVVIDVQQVVKSNVIWTQNGYPWFEAFPAQPYLVSLYKNAKDNFPDYDAAVANGGFDVKTRTFPAKIGEVLEIVWQNIGNTAAGVVETHPFHAHGEHFYDIGTGSGAFDAIEADRLLQERLANGGGGIKRDTTNLYRSPPPETSKPGDVVSWRAWRIRVQSAGVWMMHCHILQHMMMGMQTVWVFGSQKDLQPLTMQQAAGYLEFGGNAYGNESYDPTVVHYWHD